MLQLMIWQNMTKASFTFFRPIKMNTTVPSCLPLQVWLISGNSLLRSCALWRKYESEWEFSLDCMLEENIAFDSSSNFFMLKENIESMTYYNCKNTVNPSQNHLIYHLKSCSSFSLATFVSSFSFNFNWYPSFESCFFKYEAGKTLYHQMQTVLFQ